MKKVLIGIIKLLIVLLILAAASLYIFYILEKVKIVEAPSSTDSCFVILEKDSSSCEDTLQSKGDTIDLVYACDSTFNYNDHYSIIEVDHKYYRKEKEESIIHNTSFKSISTDFWSYPRSISCYDEEKGNYYESPTILVTEEGDTFSGQSIRIKRINFK